MRQGVYTLCYIRAQYTYPTTKWTGDLCVLYVHLRAVAFRKCRFLGE